jgi:hypothetical protein
MTEFIQADFSMDTELEILLAVLNERGFLLLRQALPIKSLQTLYWKALQAYNRADFLHQQGNLPHAEKLFYQYGHVPPQACYFPQDPYLALVQLLKPLWPLLQACITEPVLIYQNSLFRRQMPEATFSPALPWHQDAAFLSPLNPVWNCWCPLQDCGKDAPGIELLDFNIKEKLTPPQQPNKHQIKAGDPYDLYAFSEQFLTSHFPNASIWSPEMQVGDVLLFHERILHRTALQPSMHKSRLSLEMRLVAKENAQNCDSLLIPLPGTRNA